MRPELARPEKSRRLLLGAPGASLLSQLKEYAAAHGTIEVGLLTPDHSSAVVRAVRKAHCVILDATEDPETAGKVLRILAGRSEAHKTAVYTETLHPGLELFVRLRGALLAVGPLSTIEWTELIEGLAHAGGGPCDPAGRHSAKGQYVSNCTHRTDDNGTADSPSERRTNQ